MHAGNGLHQRAVAVFQAFTIQRLKTTNIRVAILRQFDIFTVCDIARHAERPHALIAQLTRHMAMDIAQHGQHMINIAINRRNEFQKRFCEIGGNPLMSQR